MPSRIITSADVERELVAAHLIVRTAVEEARAGAPGAVGRIARGLKRVTDVAAKAAQQLARYEKAHSRTR
jgi:hypothetical protein